MAVLPVIVPIALFDLIGSLQNVESAEAAGDSYPTRPSLAVNGLGAIVAALFVRAFRRRFTSDIPAGKRWGRGPVIRS